MKLLHVLQYRPAFAPLQGRGFFYEKMSLGNWSIVARHETLFRCVDNIFFNLKGLTINAETGCIATGELKWHTEVAVDAKKVSCHGDLDIHYDVVPSDSCSQMFTSTRPYQNMKRRDGIFEDKPDVRLFSTDIDLNDYFKKELKTGYYTIHAAVVVPGVHPCVLFVASSPSIQWNPSSKKCQKYLSNRSTKAKNVCTKGL